MSVGAAGEPRLDQRCLALAVNQSCNGREETV